MTAKEFLETLDRQQLISRNIARQLHEKVDQGGSRVTAESILKFLVKKELISRADAKRLIASKLSVTPKAQSSIMGDAALPPREAADQRRSDAAPPISEPELGLAPIDEDQPRRPDERRQPPSGGDDAKVEVVPVEPPRAKRAESPKNPKTSSSHKGGMPDAVDSEPQTSFDPVGEAAARSGDYRVRKPKKGRSKAKIHKKKDRSKSEWDSPLLLLGGGGLMVLVFTGVLLYYFLFRENADQKLKTASDLFAGGSYTQAVGAYEEFVEQFPTHSEVSEARVRLEMARLFASVNGDSPSKALQTAKQVVASIEDEPAFSADDDGEDGLSAAKRELSELLTTLVVSLADEAEQAANSATAAARIAEAREAIAMTNNTKYVPRRLRLDDKISAARSTLELVERRLARDTDLEATLAAMDQAIAQQDMAEAFELRAKLLRDHPMLARDPSLAAKVQEASQSQRENVRFTPDSRAAETGPRDGGVAASLAFAEQSGRAAPGVTGQLAVRADGVLYGFAASDGELLWRRYVGSAPDSYPFEAPGGRVIVSDVAAGELVCLNSSDGSLRWRQPIDAATSQPVLAGDRLLAASESGQLFILDADSGELIGHVEFNQPIRVPPVVSENGDRIFVVGDHSNLYSLDAADFSCLSVLYLGHQRGAIATSPVAAVGQLIVAINKGAETCSIEAVSIDNDGDPADVVASGRISGLVRTPLLVDGRRVAALSTLGAVNVYEVGGGEKLSLLASRDARRSQQIANFGLLTDGRRESNLWIAGRGLSKLAILPTGNRMPVRSIEKDFAGDLLDYPLQRIDDLIVYLRRPQDAAGLAVGALDVESGQPVWETVFAAPAAGSPAVGGDGRRVSLFNSVGSAYAVDQAAFSSSVLSTKSGSNSSGEARVALTASVQLASGAVAAAAVGSDTLRLFNFTAGSGSHEETLVQLPGPLACPPVAWQQGVVAPTVVGQVGFFDSAGRSLARPFQPSLSPGASVRWLTPAAVLAEDVPSLAISDGATLYLLQVESGARPFLAAASQIAIDGPRLTTPLAVVGEQIFAGSEENRLVRFAVPSLEQGKPIDVGGPIQWGPYAVESGILIGTASGGMTLVDASSAIRWTTTLERGWPSGEPLTDGDDVLVLFPRHGVVRVSLADGSASPPIGVGEPAILGPTPWNRRLLLTATDGSLLAVEQP